MTRLFTPVRFRGLECRNRVFVSPMCQYSADNGFPNDWHLVHLGSRAVGGAGLVMVEATGVSPEGRITPWDTGMWLDEHVASFARIVSFLKEHGAVPAIQQAHAGRKASTDAPWRGGKALPESEGGWQPLAPSAEAFDPESPVPREMTAEDMALVTEQFVEAARRSREAGFEVVEIHMAHGYLLHEFLSPLSNHREDAYGGSLENRARFPLEVARAVRRAWPDDLPVFVRISATDWVEGGWDLEQSVILSRWLKELGIDLIDCSSGGVVPKAKIRVEPGYQVPLAEAIRKQAGIATGAVGFIVQAYQAEHILATEQADVIFLAREFLREAYWPLHAARTLGVDVPWPDQYARAKRLP